MKQGDFAKCLGMTSAQLCRIEGEKHAPSIKTIARIAKALEVPITDLMTNESPREKAILPCSSGNVRIYAMAADTESEATDSLVPIRETAEPETELKSVRRQLTQKNAEYTRLENELGVLSATTLPLSHPYSLDERGAEILAHALRASCDAGCSIFVDLVGLLESRNVRIVLVKCSQDIQSRSFYNTDIRVLTIAINRQLRPERQLYRIAYELGYACIFVSTGFAKVADNSTVHKFIRRFAAAFLMPEEAIRAITSQLALSPMNWTMKLLLQLKCQFGVSADTFAFRLEKIGILAPALRKRFKEELRNYYEEHGNAEPPPTIKSLQLNKRLTLLKLRVAQ